MGVAPRVPVPVDVRSRFIVDVPLPQPMKGVKVVTSRSAKTLCVTHCRSLSGGFG